MTEPLISVIVPVYNSSQYLKRCLDSLLQQSYINFEIIMVNDGSSDDSGQICDQYMLLDRRIKVYHKSNGGVSSARNLALEHARGEYITFCDSDDYVNINWLSNFADAIEQKVDFAVQGFTNITVDGQKELKSLSTRKSSSSFTTKDLILELMQNGIYGFLWVKLFKLTIIRAHGIRFDVNSRFREDEQFLSCYLMYVTSFHLTDKIGYNYFLPPKKKNYKGDSYYSLFYIFKYLDVIFKGELPKNICSLHIKNIKDNIINNILSKKNTNDYILELYKRMRERLKESNSFRDYLTYLLLYNSPKFKYLSYFVIKNIHRIKKLK